MIFGPKPTENATGTILAHSMMVGKNRFKKGTILTTGDIDILQSCGIREVTVAELEDHDLREDAAASRIASALAPDAACGLTCTAPFAGRVNLHAMSCGIIEIDQDRVLRLNNVHESLTLATLPQFSRVRARQLVATVKIITYAVAQEWVALAAREASCAIRLRRPVLQTASLILTRVPGQPERLVVKGQDSVEARLNRLDVALAETSVVDHRVDDVSRAISQSRGDLVLLLTGSATSDSEDVGPYALKKAGGKLLRFGMPVDPGNLLFLGRIADRPVIGLPGCARSPALNGTDWVLERTICGIPVGTQDIAAMGIGGLLKEVPTRPHPRAVSKSHDGRPFVEVAVIDTEKGQSLPQLLQMALESRADQVRLVSPHDRILQLTSKFPDIAVVTAASRERGSMIRMAVDKLAPSTDAVLLLPTDCPDVTADELDRLIAAFSPSDGREICRLAWGDGISRPPALFGRRFFETLTELEGTGGAAAVAAAAQEFTVEIQADQEMTSNPKHRSFHNSV